MTFSVVFSVRFVSALVSAHSVVALTLVWVAYKTCVMVKGFGSRKGGRLSIVIVFRYSVSVSRTDYSVSTLVVGWLGWFARLVWLGCCGGVGVWGWVGLGGLIGLWVLLL